MTHIIITSNTQIQIPEYARSPDQVGDWIPNRTDNVIRGVYNILNKYEGNRNSIFRNPVANSINSAIVTFRTLVTYLQTYTTNPADFSSMVFFANTSNATITFLSGNPANTNTVVVVYESNSVPHVTNRFTANGAQSVFTLTQPPDSLPDVFVNSVWQQPNIAFSYVPQYEGIISKLQNSLLPHTNRLCGITKARTESEIDLDQILAYGIALNTLDEQNIANNVMFGLASLFCGDVLQGYNDIVIDTLLPAIRSNTQNSAIVGTQLNAIRDGIDNMIQSDLNFHAQIRQKLELHTLASSMKSVYSEPSGRWLIENLIGTDELNATLSPDKLLNNDPT